VQPEIAKRFGYGDDETSLGVEKFMRDYYLHARAVHRVSRRLIVRCREGLSRRASAARRHRQAALADGLVFFDGRLHLAEADPRTFAEDRTRLMKVFWHLHRLGCELSSDLERAVEDSLELVTTRSAPPRSCATSSSRSAGTGAGRADPAGNARARPAGPLPAGSSAP